MESDVDVLIIGAGQAGVPLSHALAEAGRKVILAERRHLGGSCVNFGCTPTKAAIASARLAHDAGRAAELGVRVTGVEVDFAAVIRRARAIATESRVGLEKRFAGSANPALLSGHARLRGRRGDRFVVEVGERTVIAREVVLDTGTRTYVPPIPGLRDVPFLHAGNWLDHEERPEHLLVLGGGVIALEMGQFYRRMGSQVTIIDRGDRILRGEDDDVAAEIHAAFVAEGIAFRTSTIAEAAARDGEGVRLELRSGSETGTVRGTHLFVATGRKPNTDDLGLETVGVEMSDAGIVIADERLRTSQPGIWVAGDIRGGPQFTHSSWDDYRILIGQMTGRGERTTKRIIPYGVFIDPELGRVGMGEVEAQKSGRDYDVHRYAMQRNGRARERGTTSGFVKVIVERTSHQILGATALAEQGAEMIHLMVDLMNAGAPATVIRDAVHIHPTLAEAVQSAVADVR
jgi:pyruvate/2-oxoglutarate dehydrogenase complex dihydrolipoamide dehydrogenase (E3) component